MFVGISERLLILWAVAVGVVVVAWPAGRICRRAGFSPWLGILAIIPLASLALLWFLALADWPASKPRAGA